MNTEKEITITDLRGKFTKDFDTFGKMVDHSAFRILSLSLSLAKLLLALRQPTVHKAI